MELLDQFFRFSGISLFLLLAVLIIRDVTGRQNRFLGAWAALSGAGYLVCTNYELRVALGPVAAFTEMFCQTGQVAVWMFSLSQFRDNLKLWPRYILLGVAFYITTRVYWNFFHGEDTIAAIVSEVSAAGARFALIAHMLYVAWEGRKDDLVEARRRFRTVYIVTVSLAVLMVSFVETFFTVAERNQPSLFVIQSFGFWMLAITLVWMGIDLRRQVVFSAAQSQKVKDTPPSDPTERHDLDSVKALLEDQELYLEAGLTIATLADKAGLPEHRLRRLINQHMGYRNFADFINHYRINAAKERLGNIEDRNIPVLTIAMDLGYGSLGPFNRAFKDRTGQTPTEYRKNKLADL